MAEERLPSVTAVQLAELRRRVTPGFEWPSRTTVELRQKGLIERLAYGQYKVTPLGFDVLKKNERRAGRLPRKIY